MVFNNEIITKMRDLKDHCGFTNRQIAERVGLSEATVQRYINGSCKEAPINSVKLVIEAMGGNPDEVLEGVQTAAAARQNELYERMLDSMEHRHAEAVEAYRVQIKTMKEEHKEAIEEKRRWIRTLAAAVAALVAAVLALVFMGAV